jgi:hypothetical protein
MPMTLGPDGGLQRGVASSVMTSSGRRLAREALRLSAIGAALPAASAVTLAHRLPILAGVSPASALTQTAELWRMTLEKPLAMWQSWLAVATVPWRLWSLWATAPGWPDSGQADLGLRLAAAGLGGVRAGLRPIHASVTGNARRLGGATWRGPRRLRAGRGSQLC